MQNRYRHPLAGCCLILASLLLSACTSQGSQTSRGTDQEVNEPVPQDRITVYIDRTWSLIASPRTYYLEVDSRRVGELTSDNYYKVSLWPGEYTFSILFPRETVLLRTASELRPIFKRVRFQNTDVGKQYRFTVEGTDALFYQITGQGDSLNGRSLARHLTVQDTSQCKPPRSGTYDGPVSFGKPAGHGTLRWRDGRTFEADFAGSFMAFGLLRYPDGREYIGQFDGEASGLPDGKGVLRDAAGNILFAGQFVAGKPSGQGLRLDEQGPQVREFNDKGKETIRVSRQDLDRVAAQQANQAITAAEQSELNTVMAPVAAIEKQLAQAKEARQEQEVAAKKWGSWPKECRCHFELCLTAESMGDKRISATQVRINEQRKRETARLCRQWESSQGEREAEARAKLKQLDAEIDRLTANETLARQQAEAQQQQLQAQLERTRLQRLASEQAKQKRVLEAELKQREQKVEAARNKCTKSLATGHRLCDCAPFASDHRTWKVCMI
ncbi:hypothetical protein ACLHZT_14110 [Aeromonas veronii]|uniref:hypothetical protein n=1 Tax=Aeromonas veronii TaxID=654 RepID=UPI003CFDA6FD